MRKTFYFLAFLMLLPMSWGQVSNPPIILVASAPSGACTQNLPDQQVIGTGALYSCQNGTWAEISGGGGGSLPTATAAGQIITSTAAGTTYAAQGQIFYQQSGDTISSIETQCSSLCTYVVTEPQTITLAASHSLSANVQLLFEANGSWTVNGSGFTLTIPAKVGGTLTQHFVAGSGSVKLGNSNNLVPVEWFGAVGDGSTNDLATIQAAINALTYGQVELQMGGVYNIAGTLTYSKNNTGMTCSSPVSRGGSILGGAFSCAIIETTAGDDAIDVHGTSGTPIQFGDFSYIAIGSSVTQTGTAAGLSLSFTGGMTVKNIEAQDFFYPFYIHASPSYGNGGFFNDQAAWTSLSSGLSTPIGFYLDSADGNAEDSLTIRDSSTAQGGGPNSCIGMMLYGTAINDVNTFNFNEAQCNDGQDVNYTGTGAMASAGDIHFVSTTVDQFHRYAFYFTATSMADSQSAANSITVLDPRVSTSTNAATYGVYALNTSGVIVSSGQFLNYGIYASGSTQLTLTGNTLQDAQASPIVLASSTYSSISSNTITNSSSSGGTYGIVLNGSSSNDNVTSNNVTGYFSQADIYTDTGTSNNTIVGNQVDPTHAAIAGIGINGSGNIAANAGMDAFNFSLDNTSNDHTYWPAYRAIGALNFAGWNDTTPDYAWSLGFAVPAGSIGTNPLFAYLYGGTWAEAWDINSANGVLDAINGIVTPSVNQTAASSTGGTCSMSTSTSCTITLGHTYTTPVCIITQQSATLTGGAGGCTVSGTTVTITATVANSETWGAFVFGNPN